MSIQDGSTDGETLPASDPATELSSLRERLKALEQEAAYERGCFEEAEKENVALREALSADITDSEESRLGRLRLLQGNLRRQFEQLKCRPTVSVAEHAALQAQVSSLAKERDAAQDQLNVLQQEITSHEKRADDAVAEAKALKAKLEEARKNHISLSDALKEKNQKLDTSVRNVRSQQQRAERLESEKTRLEDELGKKTSSEERLTKRLEDAKKAEAAAATYATELTQELETKRTRITELEAQTKRFEEQTKRLTMDLHAAEQLVAELNARPVATPISELHQRLDSGLAGLTTLLSAVNELRALHTPSPTPTHTSEPTPSHKMETTRIREAIGQLERERTPLQNTNNELDQRQRALRAQIQQLKVDLETCMEKNLPSLREQLLLAEARYERITQVRGPIQERLVEIERRVDPLRHRLEVYRDLEQPIEEFLMPLPDFTPPSLEDEPKTPPAAPEPPPPSDEPKRKRVSKTPKASTLPVLRGTGSALRTAAERYKVKPLALLAVSLYEVIDRTAALDPTPVDLFEAAKDAGIWDGTPIAREEELTDGTLPLRSTELSRYLTFTTARGKQFYIFRPGARTDWHSPVTPEQAIALNAALHRRKHR